MNVNTVKSRLYRALEKMRKYMEAGGMEYEYVEEGV